MSNLICWASMLQGCSVHPSYIILSNFTNGKSSYIPSQIVTTSQNCSRRHFARRHCDMIMSHSNSKFKSRNKRNETNIAIATGAASNSGGKDFHGVFDDILDRDHCEVLNVDRAFIYIVRRYPEYSYIELDFRR